MARNNFTGFIRQYGGNSKRSGTPAVFPACIQITIDQATTNNVLTTKSLPSGAIPLFGQNITGGGDNGTTCDIGVVGTETAFVNNLDAELKSGLVGGATVGGAQIGVTLTADTPLVVGTDSGTVPFDVALYYIMADDGSDGS